MDTLFIFDNRGTDLQISFSGCGIDCGKLLAVDMPRLDTGLLFMVKPSVSCAYTFTAADGLFLTVTSFAYAAVRRGYRHIRKTPRAGIPVLKASVLPIWRRSVLRL